MTPSGASAWTPVSGKRGPRLPPLRVTALRQALLLGGGHGSHAAMTTAGTDLPVEALLLGSLLGLAAAIGLAVVIRRGAPRRDAAAPSTWRYLGGVLAGCALVAGITSSALGATPVGALAMQGMGMGH